MSHSDRLNIAVFIDFDNIEIGVKSTLNEHFDVGTVLEAIKERGEVITKIAYADWTRAGEYSRHLTQHAIRLVQRNLTPGGDKNGADINLALDALEMAFTHPHINAYVIVGGDSDFLSLVEKLKQYDKKVFVVGGRAFTSVILQRNCHEFIAYENLTRARRPPARGDRPVVAATSAPIGQAVPLVRRALKILSDREVSPQTGLLKSTLLQLDSTFSERSYGASSFLDFVEKLSQNGVVQLKHAGRSVMVELNPGFDESTMPAPAAAPVDAGVRRPTEDAPPTASSSAPAATSQHPSHGGEQAPLAPVEQLGDQAEGARRACEILRRATGARWPMYLRNVKQILRAADGGFDERAYGFGGLMDLLRACQRDGVVRMERDRRGGLRLFQGSAIQPAQQPRGDAQPFVSSPAAPAADDDDRGNLIEPQSGGGSGAHEVDDTESLDEVVMPIDTTAELLGRAKAKRPRQRAAAAPRKPAARTASAGTRKAAAPRRPRAKKA